VAQRPLLYAAIYRLGRWPSSWLANSMPAKWACRSRLNGHSGWPWPNRRPSCSLQQLDLSGTALSPRLWPNRRVASANSYKTSRVTSSDPARFIRICTVAILFASLGHYCKSTNYCFCIGVSRYIAITSLSITAVFLEYLWQFLIDLNQIYSHSSVPKNTSPLIFSAS